MTERVTIHFNIYECGRNLLDQLDVTYQRAFMATPQDECYNTLLDTLVKDNNLRGEPFSNKKNQKAVGKVIEETEAEFERNYSKITCNTSYQSPILKKDVLTINYSVYYELDEHVNTISDSSKQVHARNDPIKETHIVNRVHNLSVGVGSIELAVIIIVIIRQGSTQFITNRDTNIGTNLVMHVLTNSSEQSFNTNLTRLNTFQSEVFVIGSQDKSVERNRKIICTSRDIRNIRGDNSRIGTPGVNKEVWSPRSDTTSNVLSCMENVEKFDTLVHGSTTQERNLESSCIKEVGGKSIFPELGKEPDSSVQVNLANSVLSERPKFISLGHPTVDRADIRNIDFATSTRAKKLNRLRRGTERDDRLGYTYDFETMSETTTYRNHIKNYEIETREVFEQVTSSHENIQQTLPTDIVTRLDDNQLIRSTDTSKHEETHKPEVNPDP